MSNTNCLVYFFIDNEGGIRINHLNNTSEELRELMGYRDGYPLLLFAYSYKDKKLFFTNVNQEELIEVLEIFKKSKSKSFSSSDDRDIAQQIQVCSDFLKKHYAWTGDLYSKEHLSTSFLKKSIKDFDMVWKYLNIVFGSFNIDVIDMPIYLIDNLKDRSIYVPNGKSLYLNEHIEGPAIIIRKSNSMFFMSEAIVYQYLLNLHNIINFHTGIEEDYLNDTKEFIDKTFHSFLKYGDLKDKTFWYVAKKDGHLYLNRNQYILDSNKLKSIEGYSSVITFEYNVVEDSRYIVINDISMEDMSISSLYRDMFSFISRNLSYIGHIDDDGKEIEDAPIYIFEGIEPSYSILKASNLPIWVYVQTLLATVYDFDPKDIKIIKGDFEELFAFKYLDMSIEKNREYLSDYFDDDFYDSVMLWNSSQDSLIAKWNQFVEEYIKYAFKNKKSFINKDLKKTLNDFKKNILQNEQNSFLLECFIGIICEDNSYLHQYNIFKIFSEVVGLTGLIREDMLSKDEESDEEIIDLMSDIQSSLFFMTLKSMASFCNIKYGIDFSKDEEIEKNDIVIDNLSNCIYEVKSVLLEPDNRSDDNPEGITYCCKDLVSGEVINKIMGEVAIFDFSFLDKTEYNEKTAISENKMNKYSKYGEEFYKKMLERFLRNKKRHNPLDYVEDEDSDPPSLESYLNMQRDQFNREEGSAILENMLNNCRRVKSYGN